MPLRPTYCSPVANGIFPENQWNPLIQRHPNGAVTIHAVIMTAENPSDHHAFLTHFTGQRDMTSTSSGVVFELPRGRVEVLSPVAFRARTGIAADDAPRLRALRVGVTSLAETARFLNKAHVPVREQAGHLIVPPDFASGVTLIFEPATQAPPSMT